MSEHSTVDLAEALERLIADQPPTNVDAALTRTWRRFRRRRKGMGVVIAAAVVAAVLGGVAVLRAGGEGSVVVTTPAPAADTGSKQVDTLPSDPDYEIFLRPKATDDAIKRVRAALAASADVVAFRYLDHDAAYARLRELFGDVNPALVDFTEPASLPVSFLVVLGDGTDRGSFTATIAGLPDVFEVVEPDQRSLDALGAIDATSASAESTAPVTAMTSMPGSSPSEAGHPPSEVRVLVVNDAGGTREVIQQLADAAHHGHDGAMSRGSAAVVGT